MRPLPDLLCLGYGDRAPEFAAAPRRAVAVATVCGRVRLGSAAQLGPGCVIRGDGHDIRIGDDFFLGERATVHALHADAGAVIGAGVTVGANAVLRSCQVGDRCVLEDGVVVLEGAVLEAGLALEKGALVPAGARLAGGQLYRGNPAAAVRALDPGELALLRGRLRHAPVNPDLAIHGPRHVDLEQRARWAGFVALTAEVDGQLELAHDASVWFGARVDGGRHGVVVGEGSNLQDNCRAYAMSSPLWVGAGVTVGHNACLQDCRIGDGSMIGAAAFVAAGTTVGAEVLLAPGSVTLPRQVLEGGWHWGGRPARALAPLSAADHEHIRRSAAAHRDYLRGFRQSTSDFWENFTSSPRPSPAGGSG